MRRRNAGERGFAVVGSAIILSLALFMGFAAAVIVQRNSLLHRTKLSLQRVSRSAHEDLNVNVTRNIDNTNITVTNGGSAASVVEILLLKHLDNSLESRDEIGGCGDDLVVNVLEEKTCTIGENIGENEVGVFTRLGNVFWEEG